MRYFNVFGPRQDPASQYAAVVPKFVQAALNGEPLEIHGDGLQSRDFTYISNVVRANLLAAQASRLAGEVVNVACGYAYSVLDIKDTIARLLGKELKVYYAPTRKGTFAARLPISLKQDGFWGMKLRWALKRE